MRFCFFILLLVSLVGVAPAQTDVPAKKSKRSIRVLTVGDPPPFKQVIENGVRREVPPPPGSLPPIEVSVAVAAEGDGEEFMAGVSRLQLGRMSAPLTVPQGELPLLLRKGRDAKAGEAWMKVNPPPIGDFYTILWRKSREVTWDEASFLCLPATAPPGTVTLLNVTPATLAIYLGTEKIALAAGKSVRRPLVRGTPLGFQYALANTEGKLVRQASMSLEQPPSDRSLVVIYVADSPSARKPLNVVVHREEAIEETKAR